VDESTFVEGDLDFKAALTKINASSAEMIFVPNYYEPDALIAKQAQEIGYSGYLLGGDGWDNLDHMVGTAGASALQKAYFINHYFPGDTMKRNQDFVSKYTSIYGSAPPSFAALGYDLMYFVADAIERSGSTNSVEVNKAIAATTNFEGITGSFAMGENHDPIKSAMVIGYDADGNYILVDKVQ
jgi:branched-chain amino acid transport system substrate-binding protein